ncbi:sphingomyelin phosphodiesterase isoform X2 [Procambarus clarkii]|uniref:sphingomyelin phosphodiesterase isoform X2 n=1 Tax=Procambarus clarkii TaxID=6728 RepID=UPI001E673BD1|nr:sphingomyelin phosphodiesterase-like isoform X2 [Procambarus clarkii]
MLSSLLLQITTFLTSLGLGEWFGAGAGSPEAMSRALPTTADPQVLLLSNEIDSWMAQPEQTVSNMPFHLYQVLNALNGSDTEVDADDPDRAFTGAGNFCVSCNILSNMVIGYSRLGGPIDIMANFLVKICFIIGYRSIPVCRGIINQDKERLEYILRNSNSDADEVCALMLGNQGCGSFRRAPWNVVIPPSDFFTKNPTESLQRDGYSRAVHTLPEQEENVRDSLKVIKQQLDRQHAGPQTTTAGGRGGDDSSGKKVLKVLHLTDPHFDPDYLVGANAVCDAPMCCNADSGPIKSPKDAAGKWGDYRNCDSPRWLLQHMLHHIIENHPDIDYVLCTGDLVPHHIWKISRKDNLAIMRQVTNLVTGFFPDIPMFGAVGNHESFPRDSFPPPEVPEVWSKFGVQWLYDAVAEQWEKMMKMPTPSSARFGGYYSILARPGLRIISINTNYCYRFNWWLLYKSVDPGLVLRWLVSELQQAEVRGELVHIIGHVPPYYNDCYMQWAHQFSRIVTRYASIIKGQFYGHSHLDEFRVHYDVDAPDKPIGIQYITPNNGPFHNLNPSYRIFYIDGDYPETTRNVLDHETWVMNLTHANKYDNPYWYKLYSARQDLQLPSLEPQHWDQLVKKMASDPELFNKYYRYQVQDSDNYYTNRVCGAKCHRRTLCTLVEGDKLLPRKCPPKV